MILAPVILGALSACLPGGKDGAPGGHSAAVDSGATDTGPESGASDTGVDAETASAETDTRETGGGDPHTGDLHTGDPHTGDAHTSDTSPAEIDSADTGPCVPSTWFADADGDGFGDSAATTESCDAPEGAVSDGSDCDDTRADVYPGADEACRDGLVNDCDDVDGSAALSFCSGSGPFELDSSADAKLVGIEAFDGAGGSVVRAGDVNGDLAFDLLISAHRDDPVETSYIYVVSGSTSGTASLSLAMATLYGDGGYSVGPGRGGLDDLDLDGYADLAITASAVETAFLMYGPASGDLDVTESDVQFTGTFDSSFGKDYTSPGDVDGDGLPDIFIGAQLADLGDGVETGTCATGGHAGAFADRDVGAAYLFLSPVESSMDVSAAEATLYGEEQDNYAGRFLSRVGDLDGDGLADLYLSATNYCDSLGAAYVVLGPVSGDQSLVDADARIAAEVYGSYIGRPLAGAGDTDGDGTPDLMLTDPDWDRSSTELSAGRVYLFLGPVSGEHDVSEAYATFDGTAGDAAGESLASAGDVDADGFDDLVIGADLADMGGTGAGETYILFGPVSGSRERSTADLVFIGEAHDGAGGSVAGVGDVDADGRADVLVGSDGDDDGGTRAGAAYLLLGGGALSGDGEI